MARARAFLLATLAFLAPAVASAEGTGAPGFPCAGRWQGVGRTTGYATTWTIDMSVRAPSAEGDCGTIEYTNPTCGGQIVDCRIESGLVHVRERYTHTDGDCAPPARLEFSCEGDRMQWAWVGWEVARSTLTRVGPPPSPAPPPPTPAIAGVPPPPPAPVPPPAQTAREEGDALGCGCSAPGSRRGPAPLGCLVAVVALTSRCRARLGAASAAARARRGARAG